MDVVSHGYGGFGGGRDGSDGWEVCGSGVLVACREMPQHFPSAR